MIQRNSTVASSKSNLRLTTAMLAVKNATPPPILCCLSSLACVAGGIRERASGRAYSLPGEFRKFNSTLHQSSHGFATRVHGFAAKTKTLAREIPPATQAMSSRIIGLHPRICTQSLDTRSSSHVSVTAKTSNPFSFISSEISSNLSSLFKLLAFKCPNWKKGPGFSSTSFDKAILKTIQRVMNKKIKAVSARFKE